LELRCNAFLFDLDGVLVDSQAVVERTWRRWAQRHQLDPDTLIQVAHGRRTRDTVAAATPDLAIDREVAWLDSAELADVDGLRVVPGAKELLSMLPADRWAVVTSCGRALARLRLTSVGLPVPEVLVVSEDVKHGKPAPDGYRLAADRLGVDAAACVVFEDAPAGVAAGRAAGARVVGVTTSYLALDLVATEATIPDFTSIHVRPDQDALVLTVGNRKP
jgi:sugar-phosphatase